MSASVKRVKGEAGYTLVEMMVVVAIVGILAVIAMPAYNSYMYKSKTTEAIGFLAEIRMRQEATQPENGGAYVNASGTPDNLNPPGPPGPSQKAWDYNLGQWNVLGVAPAGGRALFGYSTVAGGPNELPSSLFSDDRGYSGGTYWFISTAVADLDGDGAQVTFESYSSSASLYVSESAGWE